MIVKNKDQRVAVLVDVQNLYYSARNQYNARINFKGLLDVAVAGRVLTRAIAYVIKSDISLKEAEFFNAVNNAGFEVKEKELQVFPGGAKKGDWDVGIVMDAIRLGQKVDSVVLVSGDGDYVPVVNYLQNALGCLVEVVAFDKTCSKSLREVVDDFIPIEEHAKKLMYRISGGKANGASKRRTGTAAARKSRSMSRSSSATTRKTRSTSRTGSTTARKSSVKPASRIKKTTKKRVIKK